MEVNLKIKAILHPNDRKSMPSNVIPQTNLVIYIYIYIVKGQNNFQQIQSLWKDSSFDIISNLMNTLN